MIADIFTVDEKYQSGLSDMLAAFPPPAQEGRQTRSSWFRTTSWPLAPGRPGAQPQRSFEKGDLANDAPEKKKSRRCCGMPMWLFIIVILLLLCAIAAAIVVPLQFFVFKNLGPQSEALSSLEQCRSDLQCQNGGANVISQGNCSCVCTSGFVGKECEIGGTQGCATTNLVSSNGETTVRNVTLGRAVPRVIAHSADNFTVPLSGTAILAKFSSANLSCIAQNSLITFNGRSIRAGSTSSDTQTIAAVNGDAINLALESEDLIPVTALTEPVPMVTAAPVLVEGIDGHLIRRQNLETLTELLLDTSSAPSMPSQTSDAQPTNTGSAGDEEEDDGRFVATEEVLDFARVAVLFILQEQDPNTAETAQGQIQSLFTRTADRNGQGVRPEEAAEFSVGTNTTINFIDFNIELGSRNVGGLNETNTAETKRSAPAAALPMPMLSRHLHTRRSGSSFRR